MAVLGQSPGVNNGRVLGSGFQDARQQQQQHPDDIAMRNAQQQEQMQRMIQQQQQRPTMMQQPEMPPQQKPHWLETVGATMRDVGSGAEGKQGQALGGLYSRYRQLNNDSRKQATLDFNNKVEQRRYQEKMAQQDFENQLALASLRDTKNNNMGSYTVDQVKIMQELVKFNQPVIAAYNDLEINYQKLMTSLGAKNGAGDYASIIQFNKMLDPRSVVREGEAAMTARASGIFEQLKNYGDKLIKGQSLPPEAKADFNNLATEWMALAAEKHEKDFISTAEQRIGMLGLNRSYVLGSPKDYSKYSNRDRVKADFYKNSEAAPPAQTPKSVTISDDLSSEDAVGVNNYLNQAQGGSE